MIINTSVNINRNIIQIQLRLNFSEQRTIKSPYDLTCGSLANTYVLGIGSGAGGSQEIDGNGTYTIDASLN